MPIDPTTVTAGEILTLHHKKVRVLAVHRFWTKGMRRLIAGSIMLDGDPVANTPRSLHTFCRQARRARR